MMHHAQAPRALWLCPACSIQQLLECVLLAADAQDVEGLDVDELTRMHKTSEELSKKSAHLTCCQLTCP